MSDVTTTIQIARTVTYVADIEVMIDPVSGQVDPDGRLQSTINRLDADPNDPPLGWRLVSVSHDEAFPREIHP